MRFTSFAGATKYDRTCKLFLNIESPVLDVEYNMELKSTSIAYKLMKFMFKFALDQTEIRIQDVLSTENLPQLCTGTGISTRVSKICSPRQGLPSRGSCTSLTQGWISLSLYKVVVDYFSPIPFNRCKKTLILL